MIEETQRSRIWKVKKKTLWLRSIVLISFAVYAYSAKFNVINPPIYLTYTLIGLFIACVVVSYSIDWTLDIQNWLKKRKEKKV